MFNFNGGTPPTIPQEEAIIKFALWVDEERLYFRILHQHPKTVSRGMTYQCQETGLKVRSSEQPAISDGAVYLRGTDHDRDRCTCYYGFSNAEAMRGAMLETLFRFAQEFRENKSEIGVIVGNDDIYEI